jgi:serine/threonine protein kinase
MAPEIVQSILNNETNKTYSNKIDIWALGEITYELLTGQHAFPGNNNEEIFKKIMEGKYKIPAKTISFEILSFINGLLQFNPEKRMNWEQIKSHEFLTRNVEKFKSLELNKMKDENKNEIEINSKEENSLFFVLLRSRSISDFGEKNEKLSESHKEIIEKKIDEKKVDNNERIEAVEENKNSIEEQKKRVAQEIKDAEKLRKESPKKLDEANNLEKQKKMK